MKENCALRPDHLSRPVGKRHWPCTPRLSSGNAAANALFSPLLAAFIMRLPVILASCGLIFAAGCSSFDSSTMPRSVREKFNGPEYQTHAVQTDQHTAFVAAKAALADMGFHFTGGGPKQGHLTALNDILAANDVRPAQQVSLDVRLGVSPEGGTEISAVFMQLTEDSFDRHPGMATSKQIDSNGIYENYFHHIDRELIAAGAIPDPDAKKKAAAAPAAK